MATSSTWTIVFDDKTVIKNHAEGADEGIGYKINDDSFWSQSKFSNVWAVQYNTPITSDEVEYRDNTPHSSYADANLGDFQDFITKWDSAHLSQLQADWDENIQDTYDGFTLTHTETEAEKIARIGPRPTEYSSS
jgi:hypothetical protein|tara:strand:- start:1747 stop:2151 length:405 start_codon:yes stop_codon:yes gene_type:complete